MILLATFHPVIPAASTDAQKIAQSLLGTMNDVSNGHHAQANGRGKKGKKRPPQGDEPNDEPLMWGNGEGSSLGSGLMNGLGEVGATGRRALSDNGARTTTKVKNVAGQQIKVIKKSKGTIGHLSTPQPQKSKPMFDAYASNLPRSVGSDKKHKSPQGAPRPRASDFF